MRAKKRRKWTWFKISFVATKMHLRKKGFPCVSKSVENVSIFLVLSKTSCMQNYWRVLSIRASLTSVWVSRETTIRTVAHFAYHIFTLDSPQGMLNLKASLFEGRWRATLLFISTVMQVVIQVGLILWDFCLLYWGLWHKMLNDHHG